MYETVLIAGGASLLLLTLIAAFGLARAARTESWDAHVADALALADGGRS